MSCAFILNSEFTGNTIFYDLVALRFLLRVLENLFDVGFVKVIINSHKGVRRNRCARGKL